MLGKIEGEEKGMTEDETVGCHHRLNGCEFEQALRDGEGQGSLMCNSPWGFRESNMTEWLKNNNNLIFAGQTATTLQFGRGDKRNDDNDDDNNKMIQALF